MQGALQCLVGVCQLGGVQFLTRRIQTEAWPILLHLMTHGVPEQTRAVYPAGDLPAAWLACVAAFVAVAMLLISAGIAACDICMRVLNIHAGCSRLHQKGASNVRFCA